MKIQSLISLAMAAFLMAACSNEEELASPATKGMLKVTVEGNHSDTRAGFDATGKFYWSSVDHLGVTTANNATTFSALNLTSGGGTGNATFEEAVVGEIGDYAVYPCEGESCAHSIEDNKLKYNFPTTYNYTKVDTDFFAETQGEGNSFRPAMFGKIENGSVTLKHLGGVICIKIPKMSLTEGKLTLTADKQITGEFTVPISADNSPMQCNAATQSESSVTINFSNASTDNPGVFYVPVPTGTYSLNIKVSGSNGTDQKINVEAGTYSIERCDLRKIELNNVSVDATVSTLSEVNTQLGENNNVSLSAEVPSGSTTEIVIPAAGSSTSTGETTSKSLSLEKVASGASLTVSDGNKDTSAESSVDNFTLSIPNNETEDFDPLKVDINMPNTTVTLTGNAGVAKYGEVTANTAANTLIIGSGVTVSKVIVKKGNIRISKGAQVENFEKSSENAAETVYVYLDEGVESPTNLPADFKIVDLATLEDLQKVAAEGGTYQLKKEIVLSSPLVVEKDMTLDLNGFALKANQSSFTAAEGLSGSQQCVVLVRRGGHLTVTDASDKGSIDYNGNEGVYSAIILTNKADETDDTRKNLPAKLTVNGGHLNGFYYGICGNGTRQNTEITINGGIVEGGATGVYHPQEGTMTVTGGEILGGTETGIEMRSGTLNMEGGTIRSSAKSFEGSGNGSGTTVKGAAVAVSQHTTQKLLSATISGDCMLEGIYALYENDYHGEPVNNITLSIKGGMLNGQLHSENCSAFVTGGTFSDPNVLHYLGSGANVTLAKSETAMKLDKSVELSNTVTIDLGGNTLTSTGEKAFVVGTGANVTIKKGQIGTSEANDKLSYGVYANESAVVALENVVFSEMVMYAYNGAGTLTATGCKFQGWLSGWCDGGTFDNCTFTKGKAYYPAAICYGNTEFTLCKFYKNGTDPDVYDDTAGVTSWSPAGVEGGYFDCNYVVSATKTKTVTMTTCTFFNEDEDASTGTVTVEAHPYLIGWGDAGTWEDRLTIDGGEVNLTPQ